MNFDTTVTRTLATQNLLLWLKRENSKPALGGNWMGSRSTWSPTSVPRALGWEEQKEVLGKEPAVFGFEYLETNYLDSTRYGIPSNNIQWLSRRDTIKLIIEKTEQGGIITINKHMPNFVTYPQKDVWDIKSGKGTSWDTEGDVVEKILPGGSHHNIYKKYLDGMADYFRSLAVNGSPIPILFRPFHEMNGTWFWWGNSKQFVENGETKKEIVKLWRFTWNYLTHCKNLRSLVWVWSVNIDYTIPLNFHPYWPGSMYVDVVALDGYIDQKETNQLNNSGVFQRAYNHLEQISDAEGGLPIAISEFGFNYHTKREAAVWKEKLPKFLKSLKVKPTYFLFWNSQYGPLVSSYPNEQEKFDDANNFKEFVFPKPAFHGQIEKRFLLLGEK